MQGCHFRDGMESVVMGVGEAMTERVVCGEKWCVSGFELLMRLKN